MSTEPAMVEAPRAGAGGTLRAAALGLGPLAAAALLTAFAAYLHESTFADVLLLPPWGIGAVRTTVAVAALLCGYFAVFFAPGLLLMRALGVRTSNAPANAVAAFVLSLVGVSVAWIVAQAATRGIAGRSCLFLTVAVLDVAALLAGAVLAAGAPALPSLPARHRGTGRRELLVPVLGVLLLAAAAWLLMPGKITIEALEGDATEVHGFAASLAASAFPEWDLESGAWGFYPTFMFVGYPVFFSIALLGDTEAAVRLPALLFLGMLVLSLADLAGRGRTRAAGGSLNVLVPMLAVGYLSLQVGAYYAGYHPFHGDLACSPLEEWAVTALAACALVLLREGAAGLAAVAALLSILTFPSGLMLAGLIGLGGLLSGERGDRRAVLRWGFALLALLAVYAVLLFVYTVTTGIFDAMIGEWWAKYFQGRARFAAEAPERMLVAAGWWALLAGGLPVLALPFGAFGPGRMARWLSVVTLAWVAFFLLSPNKNIHYFMPVALAPMAVALRLVAGGGDARRTLAAPALLTLSATAAIALSWPRPAPPYTADREFGRRTVFLAATERQAVDYSRVLFHVMDPLWKWQPGRPWTIGHHTWVMYAARDFDPSGDYDFWVGPGPAPRADLAEITRTTTPDGTRVTWWARGGRSALREWRERTYPLRTERSRFNFEMPPPAASADR